MKYIVANIDPQIHPCSESMRRILAEVGAELIEKECETQNEIVAFASKAHAIMTARAPVTSTVIGSLSECKVIGRFGAGTDNVDHHSATRHKIVVVYVPDFCVEEVSDHALMFLLACNKKLLKLDQDVRGGRWGFQYAKPIPALREQTLGLVGVGRIAQSLARKAQSLGMTDRGYDPYVPMELWDQRQVKAMELHQLLAETDYVSLHTPLTSETQHLVGKKELAQMRPTAYLINCARGEIVDEIALVDALRNNRIAGAALDCLTQEPPEKDNPLFELPSVIFTPHSAAYSESAIAYLRESTVRQVADVLAGRKPTHVRNPDVLQEVELC